jgi:transcription elongation factor Elf1
MTQHSARDQRSPPSNTPCPRCGADHTEITTHGLALVFLRCQLCGYTWDTPERRKAAARTGRVGGEARPDGFAYHNRDELSSDSLRRVRRTPLLPSVRCATIRRTRMDRRRQPPDIHPLVSGFACPSCAAEKARLATVLEWFLYLRCDACDHIWSHPERRQKQRRSVLPDRAKRLDAKLPAHDSERREA